MTPRDYAWKLHDDSLKHGNETVYEFVSRVEEIVKAAGEEEREACARIIKKEIESWDRESVVELRESIMHEIQIRARSQS